jgi:hypothetical protein
LTLSPDELPLRTRDPMEQRIERALLEAGIPYVVEGDRHPAMKDRQLDFYQPVQDLFVEVKQLHSDRITQQMACVPNLIVGRG